MNLKIILTISIAAQLLACSSGFFGDGVNPPNKTSQELKNKSYDSSLSAANSSENSSYIPSIGVGEFKEGEWHLTFKHLNLSDIGLEEEAMNFGLAKAFNSVSQVSEVVQIPALPGGLSYSVDPDKFGLTDAQKRAIESCSELKTTKVDDIDFWEADSFMYCILEPRMYYNLIGITGIANRGNIELATERKFAAPRSQGNHSIIGVVDSTVANGNNRLIERIERPDGGVYWGTGDYLNPAGLRTAMQSGVFPGQRRAVFPTLKAGEFMWDMPNGFIGFALSGFAGQARYEARRDVATDQGRDDRYVIAGYGCMSCHATGYNAGEYASNVGRGTPTANYPSKSEFESLIAKDNARYKAAMMKLGYPESVVDGPEPVTAIVTNFEKAAGIRYREAGGTGALFGR